MRLNVISWNIRHLRWDKVTNYLKDILSQTESGHIMFFYENKKCNKMGAEFVQEFKKGLAGSKATGSERLDWGGYKYDVGTNEFVWVIYSKSCKTGAKSKFGAGQNFSLSISAQHQHDKLLETEGMKALRNSSSVTILSALSVGQGDFRIPALFHFTLTKPNGATKTIRIAGWHAPGPATGAPPLLNYVFQEHLKDKVDLFVGDFNMTGLGEDVRTVSLPMTLCRTNTSTTITQSGPVVHEEGLDLVYRNANTMLLSGQMVTGSMVGRATVGVVPVPGNDFAKAFELSDHRPIVITLKGL